MDTTGGRVGNSGQVSARIRSGCQRFCIGIWSVQFPQKWLDWDPSLRAEVGRMAFSGTEDHKFMRKGLGFGSEDFGKVAKGEFVVAWL